MSLAEGGVAPTTPWGLVWGLTASRGRVTPRVPVGLGTNLGGKRTRA